MWFHAFPPFSRHMSKAERGEPPVSPTDASISATRLSSPVQAEGGVGASGDSDTASGGSDCASCRGVWQNVCSLPIIFFVPFCDVLTTPKFFMYSFIYVGAYGGVRWSAGRSPAAAEHGDDVQRKKRQPSDPTTPMSRVMDPAQHVLLTQNLLRAANEGYDVSPLIENGADPMASGAAAPLHPADETCTPGAVVCGCPCGRARASASRAASRVATWLPFQDGSRAQPLPGALRPRAERAAALLFLPDQPLRRVACGETACVRCRPACVCDLLCANCNPLRARRRWVRVGGCRAYASIFSKV